VSDTTSTVELRSAFTLDLERSESLRWKLQGLGGGSGAYVLASLLSDLQRPALIVVADGQRAEELALELQTLFGERLDQDFLSRRVHSFPAPEVPPLEMVSPAIEVQAARVAALYQLSYRPAPIVVASADALAARTLGVPHLRESALRLTTGVETDLDALVAAATDLGYRQVGLVEEAGEVAVRGGIVDLWPAGSEYPCRCELFGDFVESIRYFDPADQRSFRDVDELVVLPVGLPLHRLAEPSVRRAVHARCNDLMVKATERRQIDGYLLDGARFPGVELFSPYLYPERAWLADHLPGDAIVTVIDRVGVERAIDDHEERLMDAAVAARDAGTFFPEESDLFVEPDAIRGLLERRPVVELDYAETSESSGVDGERVWRLDAKGNERFASARARVKARRGDNRFAPMVEELRASRAAGSRLVVLASDPTQLVRLAHLLELSEVQNVTRADTFSTALEGDVRTLWLVQGHLERGFRFYADRLVVVTDEEIFGQRRRAARRRKVSRTRLMTALAQIQPGDYMVHVDHGIGVYRGLKHIAAGGTEGDFIHLEYAGGDRYYLPVDRINLVEKYTGSGTAAPALSRLGSQTWSRTKSRARESILQLAHELLEIEAFRAVHRRSPFAECGADFEDFEARFPFEETDGQQTAVTDIKGDLQSEKPMDRVVCGDVGYGKTEVAMRAAYLTVMAGRQVAFLVPTTVLARQHFDTLAKRFEGYPVRTAMLSRFHSKSENQAVVAGLANGIIDIVVGTHRMLQRDVHFDRLGLLVIDEEHRFGVKAKERIKAMRREVDVLTMTATPIPRTLQLALTGVRDLSLIETPPVDRLAIRTYVARFDEGLVKQAIERELGRNGQVFFVHNRVASIQTMASRLDELVPKARVAIAHGQMKESELERVMLSFLAGEIDVLVCTSIIESGLDIPNANTILVNRADTFGLAQLYQIRGRVGRSHRRAYAYLLVPSDRSITDEARQRLTVLQELDDLGSGFRIAAHDMEIRGAGNLLGKEQSGHVTAIGFELFMQMMEEATQELRGRPVGPHVEPEIELGADAYIAEDYIPDVGERLLVYKRMANAATHDALTAIGDELVDRFGPLPQEARDFLRVMSLRPVLMRLAVESLKTGDGNVTIRFHERSPLDPNLLLATVADDPARFRLRPGGVLTMTLTSASGPASDRWDATVDEIEGFLTSLASGLPAPESRRSQRDGASSHEDENSARSALREPVHQDRRFDA